MSKRSLEDLITQADIGATQAVAHWRRGRPGDTPRNGPDAAALARRAASDLRMMKAARQ